MPVYKDAQTGKWYVMVRYIDWQGERKQKCKRGFKRRSDAIQWECQFRLQASRDPDMTLSAFYELYKADLSKRLKENTWLTKEAIIEKKILPFLGKRKLSEIRPKDIIDWQNAIQRLEKEDGNAFSPTYLKTINAQFSAMMNHAVRYYGLSCNPVALAGGMGTEETEEMLFWTQEEYKKFSEEMMDKPLSYYAFEMLYWCGIREGELLALTPADFDFQKGYVRISKSYQRIKQRDVITSPKTKASNRIVHMPPFLIEEMKDFMKLYYDLKPKDRLFPFTKRYLQHEIKRGSKAAGIKEIRVHDLRHSHISLLIDMGYSALAIGKRVGHTSTKITERYSHLFPDRAAELAERLDKERTEMMGEAG